LSYLPGTRGTARNRGVFQHIAVAIRDYSRVYRQRGAIMRDALSLSPGNRSAMRPARIAPALLVAVLLAALALYVVPRGLEAGSSLAIANDPVRIAERALDAKFNAEVATRGIDEALADNDLDLANSFVDLAAARHVTLDPALKAKVAAAVAVAGSATHVAKRFATGFVTGVPSDGAALAGTALGDLFVFGDIRDAVREGVHFALGEPTDKLILGLTCVGLAITAGTYASLGAAEPARLGLTLAKVARKTGRLGGELTASIGRMLRGAVDWRRLRAAITGASLSEPALAVRAAREAVKVERAQALVDLARDVGRVEEKAGTRAALDGLQVAENPQDVSRVAKLAEKEGSRTRAILKVAGRGAIMLTAGAFDLTLWILGALFTLFTFVASLKTATERATLRYLRRRKEIRRRRQEQSFAALRAAQA
jgi:hypothetical protein